ncbi:hypothetical protein E8E13_007293 [Curvularia kusanoi]|uniref:Uncharacterized protein n=1 Tax=Curvularia kusanoi TaxID=90978 RepID=A0A9P4TJ40_CURKU|nr:hypothetical protein E8E13_007293 [Curvularia kusanoi]
MTESSKKRSYFIVPDEKVDYSQSVVLGNVLYSLTDPENLLAEPRLEGLHPLGSEVTRSRPLKGYKVASTSEKEDKVGFFAKVLELLGLGINASRTNAVAASESYTISSMSFSTFKPTTEFLDVVKANADVDDVLRNSQEQCAFLITGVAVATGVKFTSSTSQDKEKEGSVGLSSQAFSLGPSGSKRRKNVLEVSYADDGPVTLAFKVQKLQLKEDGTLLAGDYVEGAYFGENEKSFVVDDNADLDRNDVGDLQRTEVVDEISGEEYVLYA